MILIVLLTVFFPLQVGLQVPPGLLCLGPYSLRAALVGPGQPSINLLHLWD